MVKSVDTRDLKSLGESCPGSSPGERTNFEGVPYETYIGGGLYFSLNSIYFDIEQRNGTIKRAYLYTLKQE